MHDKLLIRHSALILTMCACWAAHAQTEIRLWPGTAPGALGTDPDKDTPRMYAFLPDSAKRTGCAMVICPGGGYHNIEPFRDGANGAIWFSQQGIACFVLRYRIGTEGYRYPEITADARRAMRVVRSRAKEWGIDTARIGIYGASAGGHLAAVASNYYDTGNPNAADPIERMSCRPVFSLLLMPVISMDARWTYQPGVPNFLGSNPSQALIDSFSMEKHITAKTPPTFLAHDYDDGLVTYLNSIMYRDSCIAHGIGVKFLRVYNCGHGITTNGCPGWADTALLWLNANRFNVVDKTPPGAPTGLSAQALGPAIVRLFWTSGVDAESGIMRTRVYRDGQHIQDVEGQETTYTDSGLTEETQYAYQVSSINFTSLESPRSAPASVTTPSDVAGPTIVAVYAGVSVLVEFNEPVEQASAQNAAHYAIDKGVSVTSALLQSNGRIVVLTVSPLTQGATYALTVNNVRDHAKTANAIAPDSKITFQVRPGLSKIRFYPRAGLAARMAGGVFEGTNGDPASGPYSPLYAIGASPANDQWTEVANLTNNDIGYRYIRYRAGGNCNIAEIEFYRGTKLAGTPFGSPGSYGNSGNDFRKAFDGDVSTYFDFSTETGGYTGMDTEGGSPAVRTPCATASERNLLHFSVSGNRLRVTSAASVILTNTQGMVVLRRQLNGPGIVDLSALARGVYAVSGAKNVNEIRRAAVVVR